MKSFVPLTIRSIDEGLYLQTAENSLQELMSRLLRHVETYGTSASGAKAILSLKITLCCESAEHDQFSVKGTVDAKAPGIPAAVCTALSDFTEDSRPTLFVRKSGADEGDPRQMKLATQDGRTIGPGGEVEHDEDREDSPS